MLSEQLHEPCGQVPPAPWVLPVVVVVATEALIPAFPAMSAGSRERLIPTEMVTPVEKVDEVVSESPVKVLINSSYL